jgi:hypothetical protein
MFTDLGKVEGEMQDQLGNFQPIFSPQLTTPVDVFREILDVLGFLTGFLYAGVWNSGLWHH